MATNLSLDSSSRSAQDRGAAYTSTAVSHVLVGSFLGIAWGASLRAWMALLALELGERPQITWLSTFGGVLVPTMLMGALLGAATHKAQTSHDKRRPWVVLSPLLLTVAPPIVTKDFFTILTTTGMGSGAIGVALIGVFGGYALSGFGKPWVRRISGFLAVALSIASVLPIYASNRDSMVVFGPSKVFGALFFALLMTLLVIGVSIPSRQKARGKTL